MPGTDWDAVEIAVHLASHTNALLARHKMFPPQDCITQPEGGYSAPCLHEREEVLVGSTFSMEFPCITLFLSQGYLN